MDTQRKNDKMKLTCGLDTCITAVPACDRYSPILRVAAIEAGYSAVKPDSVSQEFELLQNNFEYSKERKRSLLTSTSMSAFLCRT